MGRWGDGEMGRWGDGEMGRWGDGEMGDGESGLVGYVFLIRSHGVQGAVGGSGKVVASQRWMC
jgi:hypothetical protein